VLYQVAGALQPVTHRPEPSYAVALGVLLLMLLAVTATGLVMQRRWGLVSSLAAAGYFTALSIACPVSGHHPFGLWWVGEMACALTLVALSVLAIRWSSDLPDWLPAQREAPTAAVEEFDHTM
jgi:hypothetical protein